MSACYFHSRKEAAHVCCQCHKSICESCTIQVEGEPFCQICWDGYVARVRNVQKTREEESADIPWSHWRELGMVKAFFETAGQIVFQPAQFFRRIPSGQEVGPPLFFALLCVLVFWFPMNVLYIKYIFPSVFQSLSYEQDASAQEDAGQPPATLSQDIWKGFQSISYAQIITMPVNFLFFNLILASLIEQWIISFFRGREKFAATFQIRCYAMIAQCFLLIPFLGIFLTEIFTLVTCMRGFQIVQKLNLPQALCVAAVPIMISFMATFVAIPTLF